jgi:hypothetical protein
MRYLRKLNVIRLSIFLIVIGGLTFFSFLTAFAKDEGTLGNNFFLNFMADAFYVFRFPMHVLFWKYMNGDIFFWGLFFNVMIYAFFIEFVIMYFKMSKENYRPV